MKIQILEGKNQLEIKTVVYQSRSGGIFLDWGNTVIKLEEIYASNIAREIPDFNQDDYNRFYKLK